MSHEEETGGIGDVTSDAKGSGARFNSGKVPVELIPVWIIAAAVVPQIEETPGFWSNPSAIKYEARQLLDELGAWQRGQTSALEVLQSFEYDWIEDCARVFEYGAKKYAAWNWAKGMPWSVPTACAVRHGLAMVRGEMYDTESTLTHRGHFAANLVMLAQYEQTYKEGDDRPLKWLRQAPAKMLSDEDFEWLRKNGLLADRPSSFA